jgi:hypothetical protein
VESRSVRHRDLDGGLGRQRLILSGAKGADETVNVGQLTGGTDEQLVGRAGGGCRAVDLLG